ncbi:MAG: hypothetical protein QXW10_01860 [Candidatus Micrarchaeaceae archaeon]
MEEATGESRTTIDALVDLLRSKGKTDVNSAALALGTDPKVVEEWAKVLESNNMLKISYEMGKMYIQLFELGKEELGIVEKKVESQKSVIEEELASQNITLEHFTETIKNINVNINSLEELYKSSLPGIENLLSQINKFNDIANSSSRRLDEITKKAEDSYNTINKRFEELDKKLDAMSSTGFDRAIEESHVKVSAAIKEIEEGRSAIKAIEESTNESFRAMLKSIDAQAEGLKRQAMQKSSDIINQLKAGNTLLDEISKNIRERGNEVNAVNAELKDFKSHRAGAIRTLKLEKSEFNDMYSKVHLTLVNSREQVNNTTKELIGKINALKGSFGEVSAIDDKLRGLRNDINGISKQVEDAKREIANILGQLKALDKMAGMSITQKAAKINDLAAKSKKSSGKVKSIKTGIDSIAKKF